MSLASKKYYQRNRERLIAYQREYYRTHKSAAPPSSNGPQQRHRLYNVIPNQNGKSISAYGLQRLWGDRLERTLKQILTGEVRLT